MEVAYTGHYPIKGKEPGPRKYIADAIRKSRAKHKKKFRASIKKFNSGLSGPLKEVQE